MAESFYVDDGGRFVSTELTRGPWDPLAQHGGPPSALLCRAIERTSERDDLQLVRMTVELLRPVPLAALEVSTRMVRAGRNVESLEGAISAGGVELMRGRAVRIRTTDLPLPQPDIGPPPAQDPGEGRVLPFFPTDQEVGYHTGMEYRFLDGGFNELGPASAWVRMRVPLVSGERPSAWQRVLIAADSGNGISAAVDFRHYLFINPDLTVHLHRQPLGQWVHLDARTVVEPSGVGLATTAIADEHGALGYGLQSLFIAQR